ncbi:MAG: tryptophan synthase subunit alpha [Bacteroidota bacterium]
MNRIDKLFMNQKKGILSVYFTAGYPHPDSTVEIINELSSAGADMIEIGVPFSDPIADGPVIQHSNSVALKNGMSLKLLFRHLNNIRDHTSIPLIIMSYCNPIVNFGMEKFCIACKAAGIDGVIIPDLPPEIYVEEFRSLFKSYGLKNILMISPQSDKNRILEIDKMSTGFIYMVSSSSTTGVRQGFPDNNLEYFSRVKKMRLKNPVLIGFGVYDKKTFRIVCDYANGGIIGSAFIKMLDGRNLCNTSIRNFIKEIKGI